MTLFPSFPIMVGGSEFFIGGGGSVFLLLVACDEIWSSSNGIIASTSFDSSIRAKSLIQHGLKFLFLND